MDLNKYTKYFTSCKGVFQGGGCKAIAYIGAYKKAHERGVFFSELAGTSAGSIIAALIASGAKPEYLEEIVQNLDFKQFISNYDSPFWLNKFFYKIALPKPYKQYVEYGSIDSLLKKYGIFNADSIENFVDSHIRHLTGLTRPVLFKDLIPNLHIVCADLEKHNVKIWNKENTPNESVAKAVSCSCCIPIFFRPIDNKYVDGGILSNLPSFIFAKEPHYNRILNFKLDSDESLKKISSFKDYVTSLVNTLIEGACSIQQNLNIESFDVSIKVEDVSSVDFKLINKDIINRLIRSGEEAMDCFLDDELTFFSENPRSIRILENKEQMRSLVSYISLEKHKEIYVSCKNTIWCWELFLSLVRWIASKSKITIIVSSLIEEQYKEEEMARRRMLKAMGCNLKEIDLITITGYFFLEKKDVWKGIIFNDANENFRANYYSGIIDSVLMKELVLKIKKDIEVTCRPCKIAIRPIDPNRIIERLRTESIYENADFKFEVVNLNELHFMNPYIRALKYKQIDKMYELYKNQNIPPFSAASFYFNEKESLIGPPVAERHNGKLYIIEGNTRCVYAYRHGIYKLQILVVNGVTAPIPCDTRKTYNISNVLISDKKVSAANRYQNFDYSLFRHIEEAIRPHKDYML